MQNTIIRSFLVFLLLAFSNALLNAQLVVKVTNIQSIEGFISYGLYDDPNVYLALDKQLKVDRFLVKNTELIFTIDSLPAGLYALSLFHDLNGDDIMQNNFFGIPKEPYGFSLNYRPLFRGPRFDESQFEYDGKYLEIEIILNDQ